MTETTMKKKEIDSLVLECLQNGILQIVYGNDPLRYSGCEGICCQCGATCFYFSDIPAEKYDSAEAFLKATDMQDNAEVIANVIDDFLSDSFDTEGQYILSYMTKRLEARNRA